MIQLKENWYENADGAMLGLLEDERTVALVPGKSGRYAYEDPDTGKKVKITKKMPA